jgi:hypothetical protein
MQWVDYAGPGEAPRLRPDAPRFARSPSVSDLDEIAENVAAAMDAAGISRTTSAASHALDDAETPPAEPAHGHGDSAHEPSHGDSTRSEAHGESAREGSAQREAPHGDSGRSDSAPARGAREEPAGGSEDAK